MIKLSINQFSDVKLSDLEILLINQLQTNKYKVLNRDNQNYLIFGNFLERKGLINFDLNIF